MIDKILIVQNITSSSKRIISTALPLLIIFLLLSALFTSPQLLAQSSGDFAGGTGTADDPFLVETAEHLNNVRNHLSAHFQQTADIDLSEASVANNWQPIGNEHNPFTGKYDGNHQKISNLVILRPDEEEVGLFGHLSEDARLKNILLTSVQIEGSDFTGGLAGVNWGDNARITGSHVEGKIYGDDFTGGITGSNTGEIGKSSAAGTIAGENYTGGITGQNFAARISTCYFIGEVQGETRVAGLVGENYRQGQIQESYAAAKVEGIGQIGGLVGSGNAGAENYYDKNISGLDENGYEGTPLSTESMLYKDSYLDRGWDFQEHWQLKEGKSYPYLQWQDDPPELSDIFAEEF